MWRSGNGAQLPAEISLFSGVHANCPDPDVGSPPVIWRSKIVDEVSRRAVVGPRASRDHQGKYRLLLATPPRIKLL